MKPNVLTDSANLCSSCGCELPADRELTKCQPCHAAYVSSWRKGMHSGPTRKFPGVDIDRIHYKRGAITKKKEAA